MSAPPRSPSHQVNHTGPKSVHEASPNRPRVVVPMVALRFVANKPARNANLKTSCGRSNARAPCANRLTSIAATTASSVFPTAIPIDEPRP